MALPTPPPYTTPIPNNPFYSDPSYTLEGAYYPFVIGSGLSVSPDGIISAPGSGGGAVNSVTGGAGISVAPTAGNVVVTNTGVTSLIAGAGIAVTANTGSIVISSTSSAGTVTTVNSGTGLTGGPIVSTGTLAIANTGVIAATYTNPTLDINAQGQITSASNGTAVTSVSGSLPITVTLGATPTVSINAATTTDCGAVLLSDSTSSGSSTEAATSLAVKTAYDAAIAAIPKTCISAKGALVTGTAANIPVALPVGADGLVLTACTACTEGMFWGAVAGGVTSVTGVAPIVSSGGSTPAISINNATPLTRGVLVGCSGGSNTSVGANALRAITAGQSNTALGFDALCSVTSSVSNTAVGDSAAAKVTGTQNAAVGGGALFNNATGDCNTAMGNFAMMFSSGSCNSALGHNSLRSTSGINNVGVGINAGSSLTSGNNNVVIGPGAQALSATGSCQLAIGFSTTDNWLTGDSTKAIKPGAGILDLANSTGTNGQVLMSNGSNAVCWGAVPAATPIALGTVFGCTCSSSFFNVSLGFCANAGNGGSFGTAIGTEALKAITSGGTNTGVGYQAGIAVNSGQCNTMVGAFAGRAVTSGIGVTAIGRSALCLATGGGNVGLGAQVGNLVTSGSNNTLLGTCAGCNLTTGSNNVAIGFSTAVASAAGSCQLAIGFSATDNWLTGTSTKAIKPGAGIIDCLSSCGIANMVLTSQGNAVEWKSVSSALAVPNYGSFYDTTTQTNTVGTGTGRPITLNTTAAANNFSVVSGSRVTAAVAGNYNIQFSAQFETTSASLQTIEIWLRIGGSDVAFSNTEFTTKGAAEAYFAALNYVVNLTAGSYFELIWASGDSNMVLSTHGSSYSGPQIPSMILTVVPVGA